MKRLIIINLVILLLLGINIQMVAQKNKKEKDKEKTVKVHVLKNVNGKKEVIDTTFTLKKGEDLGKVLEKYGAGHKIKAIVKSTSPATFNISIDTDDSLKDISENQTVWVSSDGKKKTIIINDDADVEILGDEILMDMDKSDSTKHVRKIYKTYQYMIDDKGDTIKVGKNIWGPRHKRMEKIYHFPCDSMEFPEHFGFFFDNDNINQMIIKNLGDDSIDVFISKMLDDKLNRNHIVIPETDFNWQNIDNDLFPKHYMHPATKASIDDAEDADLNLIKLQKNYKNLALNDFMIVLNSFTSKIGLSFKTPEKGDLLVKLFNEKGNSFIVIELKDFQGKFDKEIDLPVGNSVLQISQNNRYFIKKLKIE